MGEIRICETCKGKIQVGPEEFSLTVNSVPLCDARGKNCLTCARDCLQKLYWNHGSKMLKMTGQGLRVVWSEFTGSDNQINLLFDASILTIKIEGSSATIAKRPDGTVILIGGHKAIFNRPEDMTAYRKAFPKTSL